MLRGLAGRWPDSARGHELEQLCGKAGLYLSDAWNRGFFNRAAWVEMRDWLHQPDRVSAFDFYCRSVEFLWWGWDHGRWTDDAQWPDLPEDEPEKADMGRLANSRDCRISFKSNDGHVLMDSGPPPEKGPPASARVLRHGCMVWATIFEREAAVAQPRSTGPLVRPDEDSASGIPNPAKYTVDTKTKAAFEQVRRRLQAFGEAVQRITAQQKAAMEAVTKPLAAVRAAEQATFKKIGEAMADVSALHRFDKLDELAAKYPDLAPSVRELEEACQQAKEAEEERRHELQQRFAHVTDGMDGVLQPRMPAFDDPTFWDDIQPIGEQIKEAFREALAEHEQQKAKTLTHGDAERNGPFMPADWFRDKFGIPAPRLRAARRDGRLGAIDVGTKRPRYHYSVRDAMRLWPDDDIYLPNASG